MISSIENGNIVQQTGNTNALWSPQGTQRIDNNFEYSETDLTQQIPLFEFISKFLAFEFRKHFMTLDSYAYNEILKKFSAEVLDKAYKAVFIEALTGTRPVGTIEAYDDVKALCYDDCLKLAALLFPTDLNNQTFGLFSMIEVAKTQYNEASASDPKFHYNENFDIKLLFNPF